MPIAFLKYTKEEKNTTSFYKSLAKMLYDSQCLREIL